MSAPFPLRSSGNDESRPGSLLPSFACSAPSRAEGLGGGEASATASAVGIFVLVLDVLPNHREWRTTARDDEIRSMPQPGLSICPCQVSCELLSEQPGRYGLEIVDELTESDSGWRAHQQMHVIRFAIGFKQLTAPLVEGRFKNLPGPHSHLLSEAFTTILCHDN